MGRFVLVDNKDLEKRFLLIALHESIRDFILPIGVDYKTITNIPIKPGLKCFLIIDENNNDIGIVSILEFDALLKSVCDIGCLKEFRGKEFKDAVKDCLDDYKNKTKCDLFAFVRCDNRASLFFCKSIGCKTVNKVNKNHILKY